MIEIVLSMMGCKTLHLGISMPKARKIAAQYGNNSTFIELCNVVLHLQSIMEFGGSYKGIGDETAPLF